MKNTNMLFCLVLLIVSSCNKVDDTEKYQKHRNNIVDAQEKIVEIEPGFICGWSIVSIIDDDLFDKHGRFLAGTRPHNWAVNDDAAEMYVQRYLNIFSSIALSGKKIGLYQHSAVGRDILFDIFKGLGAEVTKLGFSD